MQRAVNHQTLVGGYFHFNYRVYDVPRFAGIRAAFTAIPARAAAADGRHMLYHFFRLCLYRQISARMPLLAAGLFTRPLPQAFGGRLGKPVAGGRLGTVS